MLTLPRVCIVFNAIRGYQGTAWCLRGEQRPLAYPNDVAINCF